MTLESREPGSLVRSLLDPSPSLEFSLTRKLAPGQQKEFFFRSRVLRGDQKNDAMIAARAYAVANKADEDSAIYREALTDEILVRCTVEVERVKNPDGTMVDKHCFVDAKQLRMLDVTERAQLLRAHYITESYYGFAQFDPEKLEEFIDKLSGELSGPYFLSQWDLSDWPHMIYGLARLARSWRPAKDPTHSSLPSSSESDQESSESGTIGSLPPLIERSGVGLKIPDLSTSPTRSEAFDIILDAEGNRVGEAEE